MSGLFRWLCGMFFLCLFCTGAAIFTLSCNKAKLKPHNTDKVVQVGIDSSWYPIDFQGKTQDFNYFARELVADTFNAHGIRVVWVEESGENLYASVLRRAVDGIVTAREPVGSSWRSQLGLGDSFYDFGMVLVVPEGSPLHDVQDLRGKIVGTASGVAAFSGLGLDPTTFLVTYESALQCLQALETGAVQAALLPFFTTKMLVQGLFNDRLKIVSKPLRSVPARFVVRNDARGKKLLDIFNSGLAAMQQQGTYDQLLKRWSLSDPQKP